MFYDKEGDVVVVLLLGGVNGRFIILGDAVGSGDASMAIWTPFKPFPLKAIRRNNKYCAIRNNIGP